MSAFKIIPYRQPSRSAKALAKELGGRRVDLRLPPQRGDNHIIINWGNVKEALMYGDVVLNPARALKMATNKKNFFILMKEQAINLIPPFWLSKDIPENMYPIVCRTNLAGHSGDGIVIAETPSELVDAPLYVRYIKKKDEYRVHVGKDRGGEAVVIAVQRKARRLDFDKPDWRVRNHKNGFVFVRNEVNPPSAVLDSARTTLLATGLDFGAVDVIWNEDQEKPYVLEINTAPGLEGQTITDYAGFFRSLA